MLRSMLQRLRPEALLIVIALALAAPAPVAADTVQSVLAGINSARAQAGCGPLKLNKALMAAAQVHATDMAEQDYFGHRDKSGGGIGSRARSQGYRFGLVAENIAAGQETPTAAVQAWLNSPGHRRNVLNCKFRETGIAMVYQQNDKPLRGQRFAMGYYWVQVFGLQR
jgi:uncharacterized protein YkwD